MSMDMRSANDWAALKKAERDGREPPGTYDRLRKEEQEAIAKANGRSKTPVMSLNSPSVPASSTPRDLAVVIGLLQPLLSEAGVKERLAELRAAIDEHTAAADKIAAERRDFDLYITEQRADFDQMAHARTVVLDERETMHAAAVVAFHNEQTAGRQRLDEVLRNMREQSSRRTAALARHMSTINEALK
jgi:hypothetical protein